jgi:hypothetical protein
MHFYEYRCSNEECKYEQTLKLPKPLTGKALEELYCEKCHSQMERKFSTFNILNGAEQPAKPPQSIDDKIITLGKNKVFIGRKINESPLIPLPCCHGYTKIIVYEGRLATQTELN